MIKKLAAKYSGELKLAVSTVAAQLLPMAVLPMIMRAVSPEGYGSYGLFHSIVSMAAPLLCLKYDTAVVTVREDKFAAMLAISCVGLSAAAGVLALGVTAVLSFWAELPFWAWLLSPTLLFAGIFQGANGVCLRSGAYGRIAFSATVRSITLALTQLALAKLFGSTPREDAAALAAGAAVSYAAGSLPLLAPLLSLTGKYRYSTQNCSGYYICTKNILETMRKYIPFVRFTFPAAGAASVASNILSPVISLFYGSAALGCYSVAAKALAAPITVISNAVSQVYFRDVSQKISAKRMGSTFRLLVLLALPIYLLLFLAADPLLPRLFGQEWAASAWLIRLLAPLYAVRFVTVPFFSTVIAANRQQDALKWQKRLLLSVVLSLAVIFAPKAPFALLMVSYSLALGWCSIAFCRYNFKLVKKEEERYGTAEGQNFYG